MKRITQLTLILALTAAVVASPASADKGKKKEDKRAYDSKSLKKGEYPEWIKSQDRARIQGIQILLSRGDFRNAERLWVDFLHDRSRDYDAYDARRLADQIYFSVRDGGHTRHIHLQDKVRFHAERLRAAQDQIRNLRRGLYEAHECGSARVLVYTINRHWSYGAPAVRDRRYQDMSYRHIQSSLSWWEREARNIENDWARASRELHEFERYHDSWWAQYGDDCHRTLYLHLPRR
ncbi:MAG: hypothetical protein KatS3mg015_1147 [Fimbriimonadales bacterium]|nr:MAG: hypothetical protein KatS3mg015_1147 [Fimbriimonadales bacterium]